MSELLKKFNRAGLIEKLEGIDQRFEYIEAAAKDMGERLAQDASLLIRSVLSGLDPDIPGDDPMILMAEESLIKQWASMRSIHTDLPVLICRGILLDACDQVAKGVNAVILWNTAADTMPLMRLGAEEVVVQEMLLSWATEAESVSLVVPSISTVKRAPATKKIITGEIEPVTSFTVKRVNLQQRVAAATGPSHPTVEGELENPNPNWPNSNNTWAHAFATKMADLLEDRFNSIYSHTTDTQNKVIKQINEGNNTQIGIIKELLSSQRSWLQGVVEDSKASQRAEHLRLNTLWWSTAMYSTSHQRSYRDLDPVISTLIMAVDLLGEVQLPVPTSVVYTLSETVGKLPRAGFEQKQTLITILGQISSQRAGLNPLFVEGISLPPETGRLSLRDIIFAALLGTDENLDMLVSRSGVDSDSEFSMPQIAKIIFRQHQAVKLAEIDCE